MERVAARSGRVLGALRERIPLATWMIAGRADDVCAPLAAVPPEPLDVPRTPWAELCRQLGAQDPVVVTAASAELAAPRPGTGSVGAYAGVALRLSGGQVVGAVCGADPRARPDLDPVDALALLRLTGELLSALVEAERSAITQARRAEQAEVASHRDSLTGLGNRRLWDRLLAKEEERCRRQGLQAAVIVVDLDALKQVNDERGHGAGDDLLRLSAGVLSTHIREPDDVARVGGDEFAIVATDIGADDLRALVRRLREALAEAGVHASVGAASRRPGSGLEVAWAEADAAMYRDKRDRRGA